MERRRAVTKLTPQLVRVAIRGLRRLHRVMAIEKESRTCGTCDWCRDLRCHNPVHRFGVKPDDPCLLWARVELTTAESTAEPSNRIFLARD